MSSLFQICNSLSFMLLWFEKKKILHKMGFLRVQENVLNVLRMINKADISPT